MGWNTPFDESMLSLRNGVVVLCPTKDDFKGMAEILDRNNIRFASGSALDHLNFWDDHKNDTCFYIKNGGLLYGPTYSTEEDEYRRYTKCTFCGISSSDFETASDQEMCEFLGF